MRFYRLTLAHLVACSLFACSTSTTLPPGSDSGTTDSATTDSATADSGVIDGGDDSCAPPGPGTVCAAGPCCDDFAIPVGVGPDCAVICPAGYAVSCELDPAAFCGPNIYSCENPSECALTPAGPECCGACTRTSSNTTAVRADSVDTYRLGFPDILCSDEECPPCAPPSELDPQIVATCIANRCEVADVRPAPITACTEDSDCRVRALECCECGADISEENLTAVRTDSEAAIAALLCDEGTGCFECAPDYRGFQAFCAEDGYCAVRSAPVPG